MFPDKQEGDEQAETNGSSSASLYVLKLKNAEAEKLVVSLRTIVQNENVSIDADPATNSLLIRASKTNYLILVQAIERLDQVRKQVYIETVIIERSQSNTTDFGIKWNGIDTYNLRYSRQANISSILSAISQAHGTTILSTPNILTLDNEEATVFVGEERPMVIGANSKTTPFEIVKLVPIGITLKVRPLISENNTIKIDLSQIVSEVLGITQIQTNDSPIIGTRKIDTKLVIKHGEMMVISGLRSRKSTQITNGVPFINKLPFIGPLFNTSHKTDTNTELMLFIRPYIINDSDDIANIVKDIPLLFPQSLSVQDKKEDYEINFGSIYFNDTFTPSLNVSQKMNNYIWNIDLDMLHVTNQGDKYALSTGLSYTYKETGIYMGTNIGYLFNIEKPFTYGLQAGWKSKIGAYNVDIGAGWLNLESNFKTRIGFSSLKR